MASSLLPIQSTTSLSKSSLLDLARRGESVYDANRVGYALDPKSYKLCGAEKAIFDAVPCVVVCNVDKGSEGLILDYFHGSERQSYTVEYSPEAEAPISAVVTMFAELIKMQTLEIKECRDESKRVRLIGYDTDNRIINNRRTREMVVPMKFMVKALTLCKVQKLLKSVEELVLYNTGYLIQTLIATDQDLLSAGRGAKIFPNLKEFRIKGQGQHFEDAFGAVRSYTGIISNLSKYTYETINDQ